MKNKKYSEELKGQILKEVIETGNASLVASKHNIPVSCIYAWKNKAKLNSVPKELNLKQELIKSQKANETLTIQVKMLKELLKKTNQVWLTE